MSKNSSCLSFCGSATNPLFCHLICPDRFCSSYPCQTPLRLPLNSLNLTSRRGRNEKTVFHPAIYFATFLHQFPFFIPTPVDTISIPQSINSDFSYNFLTAHFNVILKEIFIISSFSFSSSTIDFPFSSLFYQFK